MRHEILIENRWQELYERKNGLEEYIRTIHKRLDKDRKHFNENKELLDSALNEMKEIDEELVLLSNLTK